MCGIAGIMFKEGTGNLGEAMTAMLLALQHRGPDSTGLALYGNRARDGYVVWAKLKEMDPITSEFEHGSEIQKEEIFEAITKVGGKIRQTELFTEYALRLVVDYPGDIRKLVDVIESIADVEVTSFGRCMELVKDIGVADRLAETYKLRGFEGTHGLGHVRMATESVVDVSHAHPFWAYPFSDISVVHNGQITNYWKYRRLLELKGERFRSRCDSELIAVYLAVKMRGGMSLEEAMRRSLTELDGVFTYFVATEDQIGAAKDLLAAKPLVVMEDSRAVALASEEVALRAIFPAEIESWDPYDGEVLVWSKRA